MSAPDPEPLPPGHGPPEDESSLDRSTSGDRVSIFEEERRRLKHRLELQELVYSFSDQMRSQRDIEVIARILSEAVSELTSFRNSIVSVLEEDGRTLVGVVGSGHKRTLELGSRLAKTTVRRIHTDLANVPAYVEALSTGEIVTHRTKEDIVATLAALTDLNPGILEIIRRTTRINMALTVPLFVGDRSSSIVPLGALGLSSTKTEVDQEDVRIVRILADHASLALYNVRLFERVTRQAKRAERSEARFRKIMDLANDMIVSYDPSGKVRFANNAFRESRVYPIEGELMGQSTLDRVHPADAPKLVESYLNLQDGLPTRSLEYRIRAESGEWLHHNLSSTLVKDGEGKVSELVLFIRDVTHERQSERQLLRRNRELEVLNALITNLSANIDYDEMVSRSLAIIAEFTDSEIIAMFAVDPERPEVITLLGHLWLPKDFEELLVKTLPLTPRTGLFGGSEVELLTDMTTIPEDFESFMDKKDVKSIVSVPILKRGTPIGYVIGGVKRVLELDEEDRAVLLAVGDQLGLLLDLIKVRDNRKK